MLNAKHLGNLFSELILPDKWCDFYRDTKPYIIERKHLQCANRGVNVVDAIPLPFIESMGKTEDPFTSVGITNVDFEETDPWEDEVEWSKDTKEAWDSWDFHQRDTHSNDIDRFDDLAPVGTLAVSGRVKADAIFQEMNILEKSPLATAVKSANKYAMLVKADNKDPSMFLRTVETWWNLEENELDKCITNQLVDISYPRVSASMNTSSNQIYGSDNITSRITTVNTGLNRESFLTEEEIEEDMISVADFGRFNTGMKYILAIAYEFPGVSRNAMVNKKFKMNWAVSPYFAFKYKKSDFYLVDNCTSDIRPVADMGPEFKAVVKAFSSDLYKDKLIRMHGKLDMIDEITIMPSHVQLVQRKLKTEIAKKENRAYRLTLPDIEPLSLEHKIPQINIRASPAKLIIESIGTNDLSDPVVSASVGYCIEKVKRDIDDRTKRLKFSVALEKTVHVSHKRAVIKEVNRKYNGVTGLYKNNAHKPLSPTNDYLNLLDFALVFNKNALKAKLFTFRDALKGINTNDKMSTFAPYEVKVASRLANWVAYYEGKVIALSDDMSDEDLEKSVMYSALARIFRNTKVIGLGESLKVEWPDIRDEIIYKAKRYCKRNKIRYDIQESSYDTRALAVEIDKIANARIRFVDLLDKLELNCAEFEYDMKNNIDAPVEPKVMVRVYKPPVKVSMNNFFSMLSASKANIAPSNEVKLKALDQKPILVKPTLSSSLMDKMKSMSDAVSKFEKIHDDRIASATQGDKLREVVGELGAPKVIVQKVLRDMYGYELSNLDDVDFISETFNSLQLRSEINVHLFAKRPDDSDDDDDII
jgi:hypothetical protein